MADSKVTIEPTTSPSMHNPPEDVVTLVTGEGLRSDNNINIKDEVKKIHEDNVHKLSTMSKEDILSEQSRLIASMGNYYCARL